MTCVSSEDSSIEVIVGTDHTLRVELKNEDCTAFDLTGATEITMAFPSTGAAGSGNLTLTTGLAIASPAPLGAILATLSAAFTGQLKVGRKQGFEVKVLRGGKTYKIQFKEVLNVSASST